MQIKDMAEKLNWKLLAGKAGEENEVEGCYLGDLLSWVMGRAQSGDVWVTVMGNVNAIAVAVLTDVSAIVLADSAALDEDAKMRAEAQGVPVYLSTDSIYVNSVKITEVLQNTEGDA